MVAQTLIPRNVAKDALAVHIDPGFLEAENSPCSEVDATIVKIVANGDLLECQAQGSSKLDLWGTHKSTAVLYRADLADISRRVRCTLCQPPLRAQRSIHEAYSVEPSRYQCTACRQDHSRW